MIPPKKYPRVLIVYHNCINRADSHGVSLRSWFADWPSENLAQIYSGGEVGQERFCCFNFKLGTKERRLGKIFFKLKESSLGQSSYPIPLNENLTKLNKLSLWFIIKNKISEFLIGSGFWEIIFRPTISKGMSRFVGDFNPQIIYCQGYNLTFTWLPVLLKLKFKIPICFQTGDDWPNDLYRSFFISRTIRPVVNRAVKTLLNSSSVRLANGKLMAREYFDRFGILFEPMMMCDNLTRFRKAFTLRVVDSKIISIVYSGILANSRWISILDLCKAAELLHDEGYKILVTIFTSKIPPEAINTLREIPNLQVLPVPSHEELPSYLKGADILFLPETFNPVEAKKIRLSISTKAHFYMMSERPILIYASSITGIVNYAKEEGWGYIVDEQNLCSLTEALRTLLSDEELRISLVEKGVEVVSKNHDENKVRARFLTILNEIKNID